jgi:hypothetical protein
MSDANKHRFEPNILQLSKSKNIDEALSEWSYYVENRVPHKSERCVCNSNITITHTYINDKTGEAILVGGNCHRKLKQANKNKKLYSNSNCCMDFEATTYTEITDLKGYSASILRKILEEIRKKVIKSFWIEELLRYKKFIEGFAIDTSEVVNLINNKIQNCQEEIERVRTENERVRIENERLSNLREQELKKQREIAQEEQRKIEEAKRLAIIEEKEEEALRLFILEVERVERIERRKIADAEQKKREEAQRLVRVELERLAQIERRKIEEERKKQLNESFQIFCNCDSPNYIRNHPEDDKMCKKCKKLEPQRNI